MGLVPPERQHFEDSQRVHQHLTKLLIKYSDFVGDALYAPIIAGEHETMVSTYLASLQETGDTSQRSHKRLLAAGLATISTHSIGNIYQPQCVVLQPHLLRQDTLADRMYGQFRETTPPGAWTVVGEVNGVAGRLTHIELALEFPIVKTLLEQS